MTGPQLPRLAVVALLLALTIPRMAQRGMFSDGLLYATIARNMAIGVGSLWAPSYTQTAWTEFYEHPPLGLALEAVAFHALGDPKKLGAQWLAIKSAALDAVIANGGTVTHHHAVGRDHRPWYDRQRPPLFAEALRAAKKALDPQGLLNPGVLIDP